MHLALVTLLSGHVGLPHSLGCSLVLTLGLEPNSGLPSTGNPKLVFLTLTDTVSSSLCMNCGSSTSVTCATGSSQTREFYF